MDAYSRMGLDIHDMEAFKNWDRARSDLDCLFFANESRDTSLTRGIRSRSEGAGAGTGDNKRKRE